MATKCQLNPDQKHYFISTGDVLYGTHIRDRIRGWKAVGVAGEGERILDWNRELEVEVEGHSLAALPSCNIILDSFCNRHRDVL